MAEEPLKTEGEDPSASEESNSDFLFADVLLRGDPNRLAQLLVDDLEERDHWIQSELGGFIERSQMNRG
jgi:hypothetical protein